MDNLSNCINAILTNKYDMSLIAIPKNQESILLRYIEDCHLKLEAISTHQAHIKINKDHPLIKEQKLTKNELNLEDLKEYPFVCFVDNSHNSSFFPCIEYVPQFINASKIVKTNSTYFLYRLILDTDCYGIAYGKSLLKNILSYPVDGYDYTLYVLTNPSSLDTEIRSLFIRCLKNIVKIHAVSFDK